MSNYVHPRFGECCSKRPRSMPRVFEALAAYNTRVSEGVLHTDEYRDRMATLQDLFNEWAAEVQPNSKGADNGR